MSATPSDYEQFGRDVVDFLRIADGVEEVFGRRLDLDAEALAGLVREWASKRGVYSQPASSELIEQAVKDAALPDPTAEVFGDQSTKEQQ